MDAPLDSSVDGRPLVCLTLAINYAISGLDTWSYHVVNILIHIAAALALFSIVRRVLALPGWGDRFRNEAFRLAWACALLWALHPIQTQAVTYVVQRTGTMMSLFYLLAVLYFPRSLDAEPRSKLIPASLACPAPVHLSQYATLPLPHPPLRLRGPTG